MDPQATARAIIAGDVRVAARLMRAVDDGLVGATPALAALYPHTGRAHVVGITGNPGSGKSTLVARLVAHLRRSGRTVGVLAVDPSSPFSGGAVLGDRVRMMEHAADEGVFIRSLASRGHLGGLSRATGAMVHILDAMGLDIILIETVGVGQDEVDVVRMAQTTVVVLVPGLGDDIQAIKAGILEIADIFVVNKADRPGAERAMADLRAMQGLGPQPAGRQVPIIAAVATGDEGVDRLLAAVDAHRPEANDAVRVEREQQRAAFTIEALARERRGAEVARWLSAAAGRELVAAVAARRVDPYGALERALNAIGQGK